MAKTKPSTTIAPPSSDATSSAAPGTPDATGKGKRPAKKADYPVPAGGLTEVPSDFDPAVHKPLKKKNFKDDASYLEWRATEFEPTLARIRGLQGIVDPLQAYSDLLHHRYMLATGLGRDVPTTEAFEDWVAQGRPGYPLD